MLGTGRLLTFSFRALVLLILVPLAWLTVAARYNEALVAPVRGLVPAEMSVAATGRHIMIQTPAMRTPVSIDGFTLHYGLILLTVLVLAAVGIRAQARIAWLVGLGLGTYLLHVAGVTLLARGISWSVVGSSAESSSTLVYSLFAVFWGLLPPIVGGAWALWYWLPRMARSAAPDRRPTGVGVDLPSSG